MRALIVVSMLASVGWCAPAWAQTGSCSVTAQSVAFGAYNPLSATALSSTGSVTVNCQLLTGLSLTENYVVSLSSGSSGQFTSRRMSSGANTLNYNLYRELTHTTVWGDGSAGSFTVSDSVVLLPLVPSSRTYTVYGVIAAGQNAAVGSYLDTISVTLNF